MKGVYDMEHVLEMGTTGRHNNIISDILSDIKFKFEKLYKNKQILLFQEQIALCYYGEPRDLSSLALIDIADGFFKPTSMNLYNVVYPDLMLLDASTCFLNYNETRVAGKPSLVVEVWSDSNSPQHRILKQTLYSTSDNTEHWYIEQDSDEVLCMLGKTQLAAQSLKNILITQNNVEIDLRHLAL